MIKSLQILKAKIESARERFAVELGELQGLAYTTFKLHMEEPQNKRVIEAMDTLLNQSRELSQVENDEYFHRWIRFDFSQLVDVDDEFERELLGQYLEEYGAIYADFKNDVVSVSEGPALIIDGEDGDIYDQDSGKTVIKRAEYLRGRGEGRGTEDHDKRNALIEAWMEKSGYFPSVIRADRYGNAHYVNTRPEAKVSA